MLHVKISCCEEAPIQSRRNGVRPVPAGACRRRLVCGSGRTAGQRPLRRRESKSEDIRDAKGSGRVGESSEPILEVDKKSAQVAWRHTARNISIIVKFDLG